MLNMNALVPELIVADLTKSLHFYCEVLGFAIEYQRREDDFAFLSFGDSQLMLEQDWHSDSPWSVRPLDPPLGRGINFSIRCPDIQALVSSLNEARISLRKPVEERWYRQDEQLYGERNFLVQDPDGYLLRFAQSLGSRPLPAD
ncbi:VOC family protein [Pseudomonas nitroreducens]|uniref:Bleomycin resistance protein n=1 Tax=Pseudomonas nitroreducens TaxID=46680 RepID=A0A5R8ZUC2_PSENT|nr:VOC family protein [Pseudomonas nitroreducens]TLP69537.1 VOC family protein [Pseudomonas nitroreducens]